MSFRRVLAACLVVVAACSASPAPTTSTVALVEPAEVTTTVEPSTTEAESTTTQGPTELGTRAPNFGGGFPLTPGETHVWSLGFVPVEIRFEEPGWELVAAFERGFGLINYAEAISSAEEVFAGLATRSDVDAAEIIAEIEGSARTFEWTEPTPTTFGGVEAMTLDVFSLNESNPHNTCSGHVIDRGVLDGIPLEYSLPGCAWTRVWIIEDGGNTMVFSIGDVRLDGYAVSTDSTPVEELEYPTVASLGPLVAEFESAITILR